MRIRRWPPGVRWLPRVGLLILAAMSFAPPALAKPQTEVRVTSGEHPGYGRLVLDAPGLAHTMSRDGDRVVIRFADDPPIGALPPLRRNILAIQATPGGVALTVSPGAKVHDTQMGGRVVIDVDDVAAAKIPPARSSPSGSPPQTALANASQDGATASPQPVSGPPGDGPRASGPPADGTAPHAAGPALPPEPRKSSRAEIAAERRAAKAEPAHPPVLPERTQTAAKATTAEIPQPTIGGDLQPASPGTSRERASTAAVPANPAAPAEPSRQPEVAAPPNAEAAQGPPAGAVTLAGHPIQTGSAGVEATPTDPTPEVNATTDDPAGGSLGKAEPNAAQDGAHQDTARDGARDAAQDARGAGPGVAPAPISLAPLEATQVWPVTRDALPSGPVALVATRTRPPAGLTGAAVQVPFTEPVGAALFSRGPESFVVFDERRPIDLAALRDDPVLGTAVVTIYPAATVIRLLLPQGQSTVLSHAAAGWRVSVVPTSPRPAALLPVPAKGAITFAAEAPGQVVAIADPATGGTLLVGTQRKPGQGVLTERHTALFTLPITGQGIVVEPLTDAISLRVIPTGFVLTGPPAGLLLSPPTPMAEAMMAAARLTRQFQFPDQATNVLAWRAKQQAVEAAISPPLARGAKRFGLAETMIGLGLGAEVQSLLKVTAKDDPRQAASPATMGLAAIAALLAGRPVDAADLADPRLTGTDEIALWRAIQTAMSDESSASAAAVFATTASLLLTYPDELRQRVLPLVLETMILGGQVEPAARLLAQREHDPDLAFASALLRQAQGDNEGALKLFDELANSRSPLEHARGSIRAIELRLAMGRLDTKAAADAMESRLYAWRGDERDLALRRRIAELRRKEGAWRQAFAVLRGARADFPGHAAEIDRQLKEAFAALPQGQGLDAMPPAELIALLDENAELMPEGPDGEAMRAQLAEKLMALDLPKRADPLLAKLLRAAPIGPARAGFGATLATLRLREGDIDGALLAMSESNSSDMPDPVRERRALLIARVQAKRGDKGGALEALAGVQTQEADETRASILEQARDWPAARDALAILAARVVPPDGALSDEQRGVVLRLATAAAHAGDDVALAALRERMAPRIGSGPTADMFRLLTEAPVRGTADLVRSRAEMGLARSLTANTNPRKPPPKTP